MNTLDKFKISCNPVKLEAYKMAEDGVGYKEISDALDISYQWARKSHLEIKRKIKHIEVSSSEVKPMYQLTERARNVLRSQGIETIEDAKKAKENGFNFSKIPNCGKVCTKEIMEWLSANSVKNLESKPSPSALSERELTQEIYDIIESGGRWSEAAEHGCCSVPTVKERYYKHKINILEQRIKSLSY